MTEETLLLYAKSAMQGFMHKMVIVGTDEGAGRGMSNLKALVREERAGGFTHKKSSSNRGLTQAGKELQRMAKDST